MADAMLKTMSKGLNIDGLRRWNDRVIGGRGRRMLGFSEEEAMSDLLREELEFFGALEDEDFDEIAGERSLLALGPFSPRPQFTFKQFREESYKMALDHVTDYCNRASDDKGEQSLYPLGIYQLLPHEIHSNGHVPPAPAAPGSQFDKMAAYQMLMNGGQGGDSGYGAWTEVDDGSPTVEDDGPMDVLMSAGLVFLGVAAGLGASFYGLPMLKGMMAGSAAPQNSQDTIKAKLSKLRAAVEK
eukprot:CAMPEP_0197848296 /NCGR_PEP_ID=MMETSP1438-20131217/8155_1 /TAXON_ID=1461541 /ORGANISM="Pterosperma sp., Strain CCMP1384" /LENGTH=241 /DNA_ID=CAMNT_0043460459 /DNA_START=397 /DNA_END=1122 /DNA_ORIENTATION=-